MPQLLKQVGKAPLRVVVVEDDAMICLLLSEILEEMGYHVCAVAGTEDDAVAQAALHHPGLMIVDLSLKDGNGIGAMERIRKTGPMPCVFISGAPLRFGQLGVGVLCKPFGEDDLQRAIQHSLDSTPPARQSA